MERELAPEVPWVTFINAQAQKNRADSLGPKGEGLGVHRLFAGQTGTGKTTLARVFTRLKRATVVFGTKPGIDSSLDAYVTREGFTRIDHWPPTKKELKAKGPYEQVKLLLWPKMKEYADLKRSAELFRAAVRDITVEGNWTIGVDEGLWTCWRKGLDLGDEISAIAFGGRSNGISLHLVIQRPSGIPIATYANCNEGYFFKLGNTNDIRELSSYTGYSTREVTDAIRSLNKGNPTKGHQFLYAPMSGNGQWAISEMDKDWA